MCGHAESDQCQWSMTRRGCINQSQFPTHSLSGRNQSALLLLAKCGPGQSPFQRSHTLFPSSLSRLHPRLPYIVCPYLSPAVYLSHTLWSECVITVLFLCPGVLAEPPASTPWRIHTGDIKHSFIISAPSFFLVRPPDDCDQAAVLGWQTRFKSRL